MKPEVKVKRKITALLRSYCAPDGDPLIWWTMPIASVFGGAGVPDYLVCANGRFIGVEAKSATGRVTPLQAAQAERIFAANGRVFIVRDEGTLSLLKQHLDAIMQLGH